MKALNWIAWISACAGVLLVFLGLISSLLGSSIIPGINHCINYFHMANSFFLITVGLFLFLYRCQCKKE